MINIANVILHIEKELSSTFLAIDQWFEKSEEILHYRPQNFGWTAQEILEHIHLANDYYLSLIEKGKNRALENQLQISWEDDLSDYYFYKPGMDEVGITGSFGWESPDYLKPSGVVSLGNLRETIAEQKNLSLLILADIPDGEGLACKTIVDINNLGTLDVYQYLWFLIKHNQRHLQQLGNNEKEVLQFQIQKSI